MNLLLSCIGRRGYIAGWFRERLKPADRIIGTSNTAWTPGFQHCDVGVLLPDLGSPAYLPALLELCQAERVGALLPFFDLDVDLIAGARDRFLALGVTPLVPSAAVSRLALDKVETERFLRAHGFRAPRTFARLDDARSALVNGTLRYPVVVKPRRGYASKDMFTARDDEELRVFHAYAPDMIVQERLAGEEHSLDILSDLRGRVVSVVAKRKVLMRAGETDQSETVGHAGALDLGERLGRALGALGHVGPLDVDLFIEGDAVTVLELNPRFGGAYPGSHLAGADFPGRIVAMLRGEELPEGRGTWMPGIRMLKDHRVLPAWTGTVVDRRG